MLEHLCQLHSSATRTCAAAPTATWLKQITFWTCLFVLASVFIPVSFAVNSPSVIKPIPETWRLQKVFPRLVFKDPLMLIPVPRSSQLCVISREGTVEFFVNTPTVAKKTLVLDLTNQCQGWSDGGLLGIAFHPDFGLKSSPNRGYFYVWYNYSANPITNLANITASTPSRDRLVRFTIPDGHTTADPASAKILIDQNDRSIWHNGGGMFFGSDGYLYLSLGDEGGAYGALGNTQLVDKNLFSGVVRIDVDQNLSRSHAIPRQPVDGITGNYTIPNDNPWVGQPNTLEEFYAIGLRSPHRLTFDPTTKTIFCGDVGQETVEELDLIVKGGNYQWNYIEGNLATAAPKPSPLIGTEKPPIYTYLHKTTGDTCIIGGYVYRGTLKPTYDGQYIFGDNTSGKIFAMSNWLTGKPKVVQITQLPSSSDYNGISSFGYDVQGNLYVLKMGITNGGIYRLIPN